MNKLENYIVEYLQYCFLIESMDHKPSARYIELERELILITKGTDDREIYLTSELNLFNMESPLMKCVKVIDTHYKIVWTDLFLYLIGELKDQDMDKNLLTNELRMIRISKDPLTNYIKSK